MKRRYKYLLLGLAGVWAIAMLSLTPQFIRLHTETGEVLRDVADYSHDLVGQQYARAYSYSGSAFRAALPYEKFVALYQTLQKSNGSLNSVKRQGYQVDGHGSPVIWKAIVDEDFVYERKTVRFEFILYKENGHWVIFSAEQV